MFFFNRIKELKQLFSDIKDSEKRLSSCKSEVDIYTQTVDKKIESFKREKEELEQIKQDISNSRPWLAKYISDYYVYKNLRLVEYLQYKRRPIRHETAAEIKKMINSETRDLAKKWKEAEYKVTYYENLFPLLKEYLDIEESDAEDILSGNKDSYLNNDEVLRYVSLYDYNKMTPCERNQLALDRYLSRDHSKVHVGKMYERYIGYEYERMGFDVEYKGIIDGFDDLGRDIIAKKGDKVIIIQCKCWSKNKEIKEAHINQLFGTKTKYYIDVMRDRKGLGLFANLELNISALMITSTVLSKTAKDFATVLGVKYIENKFLSKDYPMIKCNINNGEKIYHLPFDQMYDRVKLTKSGECYVRNVADAEKMGFRRARKWNPNK